MRMLQIKFNPKKGIWCEDPDSLEKLRKNFFGNQKSGKIWLNIEEALYLINFQNAVCIKGSKAVGFNEIASFYAKDNPRFFIRYNAYRDWRDRGLIIKRVEDMKTGKKSKRKGMKRYPSKELKKKRIKVTAYWYPESLFSVIDDEKTGRMFFNDYWFGQFGIYKQDRGSLLKLSFFETVFLAKYFKIKIINVNTQKPLTYNEILKHVIERREYTKQLYEVYEDWRLKGYVVKTGFKFGSHFRIYFPGASPTREDKWIHSRHVLHVFPKQQKMLISEWARAVRVAHGVKKTFLLSIPELTPEDYIEYPLDFLAYRRKKAKGGWVRETPEDKPRYLLVSVAEDEHIGGIELASLLKKAQDMGLELLLSITDRETSITYYVLKKVILPGSDCECYEIEWMKP